MSAETDQIFSALAEAQGEFERVIADRKGQTGHRTYRYADLSAHLSVIRPILPKHGLAIVQRPVQDDNDITLVRLQTVLTHSSGQWFAGMVKMRSTGEKAETPQSIGSVITYARRYGLAALLGLAAEEDDDGAAASLPPGVRPAPASASTAKPQIKGTLCTDIERARVVRAAQALELTPEKLQQIVKDGAGVNSLRELNSALCVDLAERLEKKFRDDDAKKTFS